MSIQNAKNKLLVPLIIVSVVGLAVGGSTTGFWLTRNAQYEQLSADYQQLLAQYQILVGNYDDLENDYEILQNDFDDLQDMYDAIESELNAFETIVSQAILPVQYSFFAEAVRRYYMPRYLDGKSDKTYWKAFAEYARDVILHDSEQENSFQIVSEAFSGCLNNGSDTMGLAYYIMYCTFWDWLPNWGGWDLSGFELDDIFDVHDWCMDEIEYEYDSDIEYGRQYFDYDYIKFPVETAFRTLGDCEDQAILEATYLESCGYETAVAIFHDPAHPTLGEFYHGTLLVHIEDTDTFEIYYPSCSLWNLGSADPYTGYTWCWLDPTWDVPFGSEPSWLTDYGSSISWDVCSIAICDIDGSIM